MKYYQINTRYYDDGRVTGTKCICEGFEKRPSDKTITTQEGYTVHHDWFDNEADADEFLAAAIKAGEAAVWPEKECGTCGNLICRKNLARDCKNWYPEAGAAKWRLE